MSIQLQYTYRSWEPLITYKLEDQIQPGFTNVNYLHIFRTQKEADYIVAYALMLGVELRAVARWKATREQLEEPMVLHAKILGL